MKIINHTHSHNVRIIEIDCVYQQLEDPAVRQLFSDLLLMRKRGYSSRHQHGILPIDTYDFIGTHYLMTIENQGSRQIVGCVRMVKLSVAKAFNLPLPVMSLLKAANASQHVQHMEELIETSRTERGESVDFTYVSSWSFDPNARNTPGLIDYLHDMFCLINVYSHAQSTNEIRVACGIPRLKTDQYITNIIGYDRAKDQNGELPEIPQSNLMEEPVVLLTLKNGHPFTYQRRAQAHEMMWDKRIIHSPRITERKKAV